MNILLLTTHLNYGGITTYIRSLARGLKLKGHNVIVSSSGGNSLEFLRNSGIEHFLIPIRTKSEISPKVLLSFLRLLPILKEKNIQIIHSNTRVTQVLGFFLSKFSHIPYISTCHGFFKPKFFRKIFGFWGKFVIAISESVKRHLIEDFRISKDRIKLIYHGIEIEKPEIFQQVQDTLPEDTEQSRSTRNQKLEIRKKLGLKKTKIIGIIARLSEVKGHIYLIRAFKIVKETYPDVELLIAGEGKIKPHLLKLVSELGIEEDVLFLPGVSDTSEILRALDIFCLPSLKEGLGLSVMEAQALNVPVIASKVGGITNLIQDEKTGLLVEKQDIQGLASAILRLLKDEDLARNIRIKAKEFIKENFSLEKMIRQTEDLYRRCVEKS